MTATIHHGDCLDVLRAMPDNSVHAIVTDPPYGLSNTTPEQVADTIVKWVNGDREYLPSGKGFMGRSWDAFVPPVAVWDEAMRVLKPGGHVLAFAGTRTMDLMTLGLRLAGFDIRDSVAWLYGSGFPKSMDIGKAIDKRGGAAHLTQEIGEAIKRARESRGWSRKQADDHFCGGATNWTWFEGRPTGQRPPTPETFARIVADWPELADYAEKVAQADREVIGKSAHKSGIGNSTSGHYTVGGTKAEAYDITAPATDAAKQWHGWGSATKPAFEPVIMARKPFRGTLAANVLEHGTGGINVDACRIGTAVDPSKYPKRRPSTRGYVGIKSDEMTDSAPPNPSGRWPANVILDEHMAGVLDQQSGWQKDGVAVKRNGVMPDGAPPGWGNRGKYAPGTPDAGYGSGGGASRFFYVAEPDAPFMYCAKAPKKERPEVDGVKHPTVKPLSLLKWLVRLVTPPNGIVLDPFAGSGTTIEAAMLEGFQVIGIEREAEYLPLIQHRIERATEQLATEDPEQGSFSFEETA